MLIIYSISGLEANASKVGFTPKTCCEMKGNVDNKPEKKAVYSFILKLRKL